MKNEETLLWIHVEYNLQANIHSSLFLSTTYFFIIHINV